MKAKKLIQTNLTAFVAKGRWCLQSHLSQLGRVTLTQMIANHRWLVSWVRGSFQNSHQVASQGQPPNPVGIMGARADDTALGASGPQGKV